MTIVRVGRGASVALCVLAGVAFGCGGSGGSAEGDPRPRSPATLEYSANPALYRVGTAVAPNRPATTGGVPTEYRVSPGLPAGLELDVTTGAIAGTPLAPAASRTYTVVAANAGGGASCQLVITVEDAPITGVVLSPLGDDALSGVTVAIAPHGSSSWMQTRTAEDGSFSLAPVGAPYDLAVVSVH